MKVEGAGCCQHDRSSPAVPLTLLSGDGSVGSCSVVLATYRAGCGQPAMTGGLHQLATGCPVADVAPPHSPTSLVICSRA